MVNKFWHLKIFICDFYLYIYLIRKTILLRVTHFFFAQEKVLKSRKQTSIHKILFHVCNCIRTFKPLNYFFQGPTCNRNDMTYDMHISFAFKVFRQGIWSEKEASLWLSQAPEENTMWSIIARRKIKYTIDFNRPKP